MANPHCSVNVIEISGGHAWVDFEFDNGHTITCRVDADFGDDANSELMRAVRGGKSFGVYISHDLPDGERVFGEHIGI